MIPITSFYLAGLSFRPKEVESKIERNIILKLESEPDNQYDENAIKVVMFDGTHIGYVPKKITYELHPYRICDIPIFTIIANYIPEMPIHRRVLIAVKGNEPLPKYVPKEETRVEINDEGDDILEFKDFVNLDKLVDE